MEWNPTPFLRNLKLSNPAESQSWRGTQNRKLVKAQFKESVILDKGRWRETLPFFFFSLLSVPFLSVIFSFPVAEEASSHGISLQKTERTQWYSEAQITEVQLQELPEFVSTATWAGSFFLKTGSSINFSPTRKFSVFASMTLWSAVLELLGADLVDRVLMLLCVPELLIRRKFPGARQFPCCCGSPAWGRDRLMPPSEFRIAHPWARAWRGAVASQNKGLVGGEKEQVGTWSEQWVLHNMATSLKLVHGCGAGISCATD